MSKTYYTSGTGAQQTLANAQDEKIPIYANEAALDADMSNLKVGQIVGTKSGHDDVIDQMKAYIRDQNELDDFETPFDPNIASIVTTGVTAQYDGFLYVNGFAPYGIEGTRSISINEVTVASVTKTSSVVITQNFCLPLKKGDVIKGNSSNYLGSWIFRYYKKRDYSNRQ